MVKWHPVIVNHCHSRVHTRVVGVNLCSHTQLLAAGKLIFLGNNNEK